MVEPGIEPGTSWLVVRDPDHQTTRLVIFLNVGIRVFPNKGGQKHLVRDIKVSGVANRRMVTGQRVRKGHV